MPAALGCAPTAAWRARRRPRSASVARNGGLGAARGVLPAVVAAVLKQRHRRSQKSKEYSASPAV
eukprot:5847038-Alexandrium_andersonii.AAC.1